MKRQGATLPQRDARCRRTLAFTLVEVMVASSISLLIMGGVLTFLWFSGLGVSGIAGQALLNQQGGNTMEFLQSRARVALYASNDASGNILTLAFDDNPAQDTDGNKNFYDDRDHYEAFQFIGTNGSTNNCSTNRLVYIPDTTRTNQQVLIPAGVRNLPGYKIFTVTNGYITIVRFGLVDGYGPDHYQSIDIEGTLVPYNRPSTTNVIAILP